MPHQCTTCGRTFPDGSKEMLSGCPDCGGNKFQFAPASAVDGAAGPRTESGSVDGSSASDDGRSSGGGSDDHSSGGAADGSAADQQSDGVTARAADAVRGWVSDGTPGTDGSWPSADDSDANESTEEFAEWPDTARPPEDRSSSPGRSPSPRSAGATKQESSATKQKSSTTQQPSESSTQSSPAAGAEPSPESGAGEAGDDEGENSAQADARSAVVSPEELSASAEEREKPPDHGRVVSEPSGEEQSLEDLREELNDQFESIKIVSPGQYELNLMELYDREEYIVSLQEDGRYIIDVPDSWRDGAE